MEQLVKKPKKVKLNPLEYKEWGCEKYQYKVLIDPVGSYQFDSVVIDVENYKDGRFAGLGFLEPGTKTIYFFTALDKCDYVDLSNSTLIGHVLRTDIHKLIKWGFNIDVNKAHYDTALVEHLSNSTKKKYGLKELVKEKFGIEYPKYEQIVGDGDFDTVPIEVTANYNGMDLIATYKLWQSQNQELTNTEIYQRLLWPLGNVLNQMEERGLRLDLEYLKKLGELLRLDRNYAEQLIINELGPINLNSPKQLLEALHAKDVYPKYKGKASTDKRSLQGLKDVPLVSQLLQFSELDTLLSSFVSPYLEAKTEVIHPSFGQTATRTGRLACYRPNLQQVPTHTENGKKVKRAFVARPGYRLVELDYSAIEPRMLAHFSKSRALTELFRSGKDFHDYTAERLQLDRQKAKVLNLSTGYRATKYALAFQLKCSIEEAEKQLNDWWGLWPDLMLWESNLIAATKQTGYITTLMGRTIYIDGLDSNDQKIRNTAERRVIENLAQGSTSDLIGLAMIELHMAHIRLINQVHDSVLLEVAEVSLEADINKACVIMENVIELEVPTPVEVKIGNDLGGMKNYEVSN